MPSGRHRLLGKDSGGNVLNPLIALAFTRPNRSIALPTTPGRKLDFRGGCAHVFDERDLHVLLQRDDIIVEFQPEWAERVPSWLNGLGELNTPRADIRLPDGQQLAGQWPNWHFVGSESVVESEVENGEEYTYDFDEEPSSWVSGKQSGTGDGLATTRRGPGRPRKVNA